MRDAWASGTNIYEAEVMGLIHNVLPLTGSSGVRSFVVHIGRQLDAFDTQPRHRKEWKALLDTL